MEGGGHSKKMPSAYIVFANEKRATLKKGLSIGEQGRELGKMWRGLSESEKAKYAAKATPSKAAGAKPSKKGK